MDTKDPPTSKHISLLSLSVRFKTAWDKKKLSNRQKIRILPLKKTKMTALDKYQQ